MPTSRQGSVSFCQVLCYLALTRGVNTFHSQSQVDSCSAGDGVRKDCGVAGCCVPLDHCPTFCRDAPNLDHNITIRRQLRDNMCGFRSGEPMACCPGLTQVPSGPACQMEKANKNPSKEYFCGAPDEIVIGRISGGTSSLPGEWPWMAAMKYCRTGTQMIKFLCSGVLISRQWVLTAGHCIDMVHEGVKYDLEEVRLGDTNLQTDYDCRGSCLPLDAFDEDCEDFCGDGPTCLEEDRCAPKHQSFKPIRQVKHPRFRKHQEVYSYDMALVKLDRPVDLNNFARPVCLQERGRSNRNTNFIVTGWGIIDNVYSGHLRLKPKRADILQVLRVNLIDQNKCKNEFASRGSRGVVLKKEQLCAGTGTAGESVCQGDSGGALVSNVGEVWFLAGLVSFGSSLCGDPGPTVFSKLNKPKLNWIIRTVDENLPTRRPK